MIAAEPRVLQCGVVGAGIAGLAAAIALSNAGHEVEIFERSQFKHEIGAAVTMTPNAGLVLDYWGFDQEKAKPTSLMQTRVMGWQNLELLKVDSIDEIPNTYRHRMASYHRVDLHSGLRRLAEQNSAVRIKLGTTVAELDCNTGKLGFADGSCVQKDLIVIADGINSNLGRRVTGLERPTEKTGRSVFRTLIPMDRLMADEQIKPIFTGEPPGAMYVPKTDKNTLFLSYPCRDNTVLNVALFHETIKHQEDTNDWNSHASVEDALGILADFHPVWRSIVGKADFMNVYTVRHGIDCPRLVKGKAIVIGDAAHPMLPSYAQGGAMALEDAASLEILLAGMKAVEGLENRLKIFEQLRLPRSTTTQVLSNAAFLSSGTNKEDVIRKYYQGPLFEPLNAPGFSRPVRDFWYGYNIISEARKAFEYRNSLDGIPDGALKPFGR